MEVSDLERIDVALIWRKFCPVYLPVNSLSFITDPFNDSPGLYDSDRISDAAEYAIHHAACDGDELIAHFPDGSTRRGHLSIYKKHDASGPFNTVDFACDLGGVRVLVPIKDLAFQLVGDSPTREEQIAERRSWFERRCVNYLDGGEQCEG